jgi:hypothetical protein
VKKNLTLIGTASKFMKECPKLRNLVNEAIGDNVSVDDRLVSLIN